MTEQVHDVASGALLVVVPAHNLHEGGDQLDAWHGIEVGGNQCLVSKAEEAFPVAPLSGVSFRADPLQVIPP